MESHIPLGRSDLSNSKPIAEDQDECEKAQQRLKETIQTLPTENVGWMKSITKGKLYQYQGFWYTLDFLQPIIFAQQRFKAEPTDIVVSSFPKTGTTWLKALAFAIVNRKKFDGSTNPLLTTMPHECIPFLEFDLLQIQKNQKSSEFPLLATHIPCSSLPESILASNCKIVYIYRDPKDVFVSLWHFVRMITPKEEEMLPFEEACEVFCKGIYPYGSYWEHVLGYWKASLERPDRILVLKYEDMKRDDLGSVKRLAEFMGCPFSVEEEKEGVVESILKLCSFENLSNLEVNKSGKHRPETTIAMENQFYFRKGKVGDWENHLTAEMKEKIDQIMEQKLSGSGLVLNASSDPL